MDVGDLFIWVFASDSSWVINDIGRVIELKNEGSSLLVSNFIPYDGGELRQVSVGSPYVKRVEAILRSKRPGTKIQKARRDAITLTMQGIKRV